MKASRTFLKMNANMVCGEKGYDLAVNKLVMGFVSDGRHEKLTLIQARKMGVARTAVG